MVSSGRYKVTFYDVLAKYKRDLKAKGELYLDRCPRCGNPASITANPHWGYLHVNCMHNSTCCGFTGSRFPYNTKASTEERLAVILKAREEWNALASKKKKAYVVEINSQLTIVANSKEEAFLKGFNAVPLINRISLTIDGETEEHYLNSKNRIKAEQ